jgi:ACS family hexuronate transporter-like MFS transporter
MTLRTIKDLRWYIAGLLFLSTAINYVDRQAVQFAFLKFGPSFHMTKADFAIIISAFQLAYALMPIFSGKIIDRLGTRVGLSVFVIWWSLAGIATAGAAGMFAFMSPMHLTIPVSRTLLVLSPVLLGFCLCRFALGIGEAGNWPGAVKAVAEWFPTKEKALASGIFNSGSSIGAVIAPLVLPALIIHWGWRAAFIFTGALGFVWLAAWLLLYYAPDKHPRLSPEELAYITDNPIATQPESKPAMRWAQLFIHRQLWALILTRILSDPIWWFYATWIPKYLNDARHVDLKHMPVLAATPFFTAGLGGFAGGAASSYLVRKKWGVTQARYTLIFASAALMLAGIPAVMTRSTVGSVAFVAAATFAYSSFAANLIAVVTDVFPKHLMASVYGIAQTLAGFSGMAFTLLAGAWSYTRIFTLAGVLPLIAAAVFILMTGQVRPIGESDEAA